LSKILRKSVLDEQGQEINVRRDFRLDEANGEKGAGSERVKAGPAVEMENLKEEAEKQARQIIAAARAEKDKVFREAEKAGFEQGFQKGLAAGKDEAQKLRRQAEELLNRARNWHSELVRESEKNIIDLAVAIAAKLVRKELGIFPEHIVAVAQEALQKVKESETYIIYAHPEDAEILKSKRDLLLQDLPVNISLRILADAAIDRGGCLVDTNTGQVEVTIEGQLERLKRVLTGREDIER